MARRKNMLCVFALYLYAILLFLSAPLYNAETPLYIFGDSLYDTGMSMYYHRHGGASFWPYGETFFGQPSGRFSDGRSTPDFLALYAGLPYPVPYLKPGITDFTKCINFASSGACVLSETRPGTINLKMQMDYFTEMIQKLKNHEGEAKANQLLGKAVYLFNIAGNDLASIPSKTNKRQYMNKVLSHLTTYIRALYNHGGRKFAFQNVGPMGCIPSAKISQGANFKALCVKDSQQLAKSYNNLFLVVIKKLRSELAGFKYTVYDSFDSAYKRVEDGKKYGFEVTTSGCCGSGAFNGNFTCEKKGSGFTVCSDPSSYLYFDAGHYTEKANRAFSQEFWSGDSSLVAPYNLKTLMEMD